MPGFSTAPRISIRDYADEVSLGLKTTLGDSRARVPPRPSDRRAASPWMMVTLGQTPSVILSGVGAGVERSVSVPHVGSEETDSSTPLGMTGGGALSISRCRTMAHSSI